MMEGDNVVYGFAAALQRVSILKAKAQSAASLIA
jgi:hypothetical protein